MSRFRSDNNKGKLSTWKVVDDYTGFTIDSDQVEFDSEGFAVKRGTSTKENPSDKPFTIPPLSKPAFVRPERPTRWRDGVEPDTWTMDEILQHWGTDLY